MWDGVKKELSPIASRNVAWSKLLEKQYGGVSINSELKCHMPEQSHFEVYIPKKEKYSSKQIYAHFYSSQNSVQ